MRTSVVLNYSVIDAGSSMFPCGMAFQLRTSVGHEIKNLMNKMNKKQDCRLIDWLTGTKPLKTAVLSFREIYCGWVSGKTSTRFVDKHASSWSQAQRRQFYPVHPVYSPVLWSCVIHRKSLWSSPKQFQHICMKPLRGLGCVVSKKSPNCLDN